MLCCTAREIVICYNYKELLTCMFIYNIHLYRYIAKRTKLSFQTKLYTQSNIKVFIFLALVSLISYLLIKSVVVNGKEAGKFSYECGLRR